MLCSYFSAWRAAELALPAMTSAQMLGKPNKMMAIDCNPLVHDPLIDSALWQRSVDALLADLPKLHRNLSAMMSGLIAE